jgi:tetratricopeptide (TPR) repeat protein
MLRGAAVLILLSGVGCAGALPQGAPPNSRAKPPGLTAPEAKRFETALARFAALDRSRGWNQENCREIAAELESVAASGTASERQVALYDAGLAYERCGLVEPAEHAFERAGGHRARARLLLLRYAAGESLDRTLERFAYLVVESKFRHVELLVTLAALQMRRNAEGDADTARTNLQRALAIDDAHMPALNLLAQSYLARARSQSPPSLVLAGAERRSARRQMLDLAALVTSQAIRKNARYAPIHNTAGLISVELADYNAALRSFARARELDPRFVEAHVNYAAVSLSLRGYAQAEQAYRTALALGGDDYETRIGLALALRGAATPTSQRLIAEAKRHLQAAKRLAPERPEAYYNEALLLEELDAKHAQGRAAIDTLRRAQQLYSKFRTRAGPAHRDAVVRAEQRSEDITHKIEFLSVP